MREGTCRRVADSRIFRRRRSAVHGCVAVVGGLRSLVSSFTILGGYHFLLAFFLYFNLSTVRFIKRLTLTI